MKNLIIVGVLVLLAFTSVAQNETKCIDLKFDKWTTQSQKAEDGTAVVANGIVTLSRGKFGAELYTLRAYVDIPVKAGFEYVFSYTVKVEGDGGSVGVIYNGDKDGKWDVKSLRHTETKKKCDYTTVATVISVPGDTFFLRLDLRALGENTSVIYKDIVLEEICKKRDITLVPSNGDVIIDGKLDDSLWQEGVKLSPFRILGNVARLSTLKNEVFLAVKEGHLYIAYRMEEPNIEGMKATKSKNASGLGELEIYADDCTETFISTDRVSYAHILVNAAGTRYWEQRNICKPNATWYPPNYIPFTGDWEAKSVVGTNEWTCEIRIKLSDLFAKNVGDNQNIFVNFTRHRTQGKEENLTWAPLNGQFYAVPKEFVAVTLCLPPLNKISEMISIAPTFSEKLSVPDILLAGLPVKLTKNAGEFKLSSQIQISEKNLVIDSGVKKMLEDALRISGNNNKIEISLEVADPFDDSSLSAEERGKLGSSEAFKLDLSMGKAVIIGRSQDAVLRGIATLILMANRARFTEGAALPALTLLDAPRMPFRSWMITPTKEGIDMAYLLRFNKLLIAIDSWGGPTIFPFESYPIGGQTFSKKELVDIFNYARARGIEPIPYFASWGRVQYLKNAPDGVKLLVDDLDMVQEGYRNLDIANPEAVKVMLKLQEEIIDTLNVKSFCIAFDEIFFGNTVTSVAAKAKNWKASDWIIEALNINDVFFKRKGVRMYLWGDMIDPNQNGKHLDISGSQLLARLPKDMTILDWKYDGKFDYSADFPSLKIFKDAGFPTIGAHWFKPKNISRMAHSIVTNKVDGICLTSWNSTIINKLASDVIRALALTSYYSWSPEDCDLSHLKFLPDTITEAAAYWTNVRFSAGTVRHLEASNGLISDNDLLKMLGIPFATDTTFIATPFKNYRGVGFNVFTKNGKPAAISVSGEKRPAACVNGNFSDGMTGWELQCPSKDDGIFVIEDGALKVTRVAGKAFMRVSQDILLDPTKEYMLRYKVKVNGDGYAKAWTYSGDEKFKWDDSKCVFSSSKGCEWTDMEISLPFGFASTRICFSADGDGTVACFRDIALIEKNADTVKQAISPVSKTLIPVNSKARVITFMHATSRQDISDDMEEMDRSFKGIMPGQYLISYADGTQEIIQLNYRVNIVAANDPTLGREMDLGLFGTIGAAIFVNLPTFTWLNPYPEKTIDSIEVIPGNTETMSLLVFGISLD